MESFSVSSLMKTNVKKITADQNIMGASKIMHDSRIGSVVVIELEGPDTNPVGIVTESDVVRILGELKPWLSKIPLRELMSKPVITIQSSASLRDAIDAMSSHDIRRLVVVDQHSNMIGIVSEKDIFRRIAKDRQLVAEFFGSKYPTDNNKKILNKIAELDLWNPTKF
jgi:CBS domain-containing protein